MFGTFYVIFSTKRARISHIHCTRPDAYSSALNIIQFGLETITDVGKAHV